MYKHVRQIIILISALALLLSACGASETPVETEPAPEAVFTAAAATASARMTQTAAVPPTEPPAIPTDTQAPTNSPTLTPGSITATATSAPVSTGNDDAEFVLDVTVPDGTTFEPGASFTKTWRLRNSGTSTWTSAYSLVFSSGTQMGAPASVPLPADVPPGEEADISVNLVAPSERGEYVGYYLLRNAAGVNFGLGGPDLAFYVLINVSESSASTGPTSTPDPDAGTFSGISLSVDEATLETACPHTFNFIATFTLNQAATVTYELEAETGFDLTLPAPTNTPLDAGTHRVNYTLEFNDNVSGWARFRITAPEAAQSSQVNFDLTCSG